MKKTKTCQVCKIKFTIEPEDFEFYKKINVPEPSFCPKCRLARRLTFRNPRTFYKRKCDFSGKDIISIFHKDSPYKVYDQKIWWSDKWDPMDYGQDYDFKQTFFEQFDQLSKNIPWPNLRIVNSVDCDYCNGIIDSKNCYMVSGFKAENCLYSIGPVDSKDCLDCLSPVGSEYLYRCINCDDSYNLLFSSHSNNCIDSAFLYNCNNCQNCFGCVNLKHKKYHIFNKPYTKEEHQEEIKKYYLGSYQNLEKIQKEVNQFISRFPRVWAHISKSVDVSGEHIRSAKNCHFCFMAKDGVEDCRYTLETGFGLKDAYDVDAGGIKSELLYECGFVTSSSNTICSASISNCFNISYSTECYSSNDLFGCVGLRHKKYCILNKQYTKKKYEELVLKIKKQMNGLPYRDKKGRVYGYGEFFPVELSKHGYNETNANFYFPITKEEVIRLGYRWQDREGVEYQLTLESKDLPDDIKEVNNSVLKETIQCQNEPKGQCQGVGLFKIIPDELKFCQKQNVPLPRLCPACRDKEKYIGYIDQTNPMRLYHRQCQCAGDQSDNKVYQNQVKHSHHRDKHCLNEFETIYNLKRKEIVYCKECYQKEFE